MELNNVHEELHANRLTISPCVPGEGEEIHCPHDSHNDNKKYKIRAGM